MSRPAVFLDRDGTLIRDRVHAADPATVAPLPGVVVGMRALQEAGYVLVVVSNNSGVARGLFTAAEAQAMGQRLVAVLADEGVKLGGYYFCPHHPSAGQVERFARSCDCRKPRPGMLLRAADELGLDLARSWMVGDLPSDVGAGRAAGAQPVLLDVGCLGYAAPDDVPTAISEATIARDLAHAAALILSADGHLGDRDIPASLAQLSAEVLVRPAPEGEDRAPGTPSLHPDESRLALAAEDALLLAGCLADLDAVPT